MNIEIFNHDILGEMHIFCDEQGLWFWLQDVGECLNISENTVLFKFKHLPNDLKRVEKCVLTVDNCETNHKFVHEKAVYDFMTIGNSKYCEEFRQWIREIAWEFDILNIRRNNNNIEFHGGMRVNFNVVKKYMMEVNTDESQFAQQAKEAFKELDDEIHRPINIDCSEPEYYTDQTLFEAYSDTCRDPWVTWDDILNFEVNEQSKEQRDELIEAFDEGRLVEYIIEEKVVSKKSDAPNEEQRKIIYQRHREKKQQSTCPKWLKNVLK